MNLDPQTQQAIATVKRLVAVGLALAAIVQFLGFAHFRGQWWELGFLAILIQMVL